MKATIVYGLDKKNSLFTELEKSRVVFLARSVKEAHLYHLSHSEVDSYIIYPQKLYSRYLILLIEQILYINAIITIFVCKPEIDSRNIFAENKNVLIVENDDSIPEILDSLSRVSRGANRAKWPLLVEYWRPETDDDLKRTGIVLSISASGCFVHSAGQLEQEVGGELYMTFYFHDFDFFSKGTVVRQEQDGFAVCFAEVSTQTELCIQKIINKKILRELMETLKPGINERKEER